MTRSRFGEKLSAHSRTGIPGDSTAHVTRVAIMMSTLVSGRMGGTEVYAENLVRQFASREFSPLDVTVVRARDAESSRATTSHMGVLGDPQEGFRDIVTPRLRAGVTVPQKIRAWLVSVANRRRIWREVEHAAGGTVDVVLFPFTAVVPRPPRGTPYISVIHDLQHRDMPQLFSLGQRIYRRLTYENPARKAHALIVVSDFTRTSVIEELGVLPDKVHRIYPGINRELFTPRLSVEEITEPAASIENPLHAIYYPARGLAHKNHARLFDAVRVLRQALPDVTLLLSGSDSERLGELPEFVRHLGNLQPVQVRDLYRTVGVVAFPSLYEGFGFPPLEAVATGARVVASEAGALPEVLGSAVSWCDPYDVADIARALNEVLTGASMASAATADSQLALMEWSLSADAVVEVVRDVSRRDSSRHGRAPALG